MQLIVSIFFRKQRIFAVITLLSGSLGGWAATGVKQVEHIRGQIFEFGESTPLFRLEREIVRGAGRQWSVKTEFFDLSDDRLVIKDVGEYVGIRPVSYHRKNFQDLKKQSEEHFSFDGETLKLVYKDYRGRIKQTEEEHRHAVVFGPVFSALFREEWLAMLKGETPTIWIASAYRQTSYRFRLKFLGKMKVEEQHSLTLFQMSGVSLLVRAFTRPIDFFFDSNSRRLLRMVGPTPLRKVEPDGDLEKFRGDTRYTYVNPSMRTKALKPAAPDGKKTAVNQ